MLPHSPPAPTPIVLGREWTSLRTPEQTLSPLPQVLREATFPNPWVQGRPVLPSPERILMAASLPEPGLTHTSAQLASPPLSPSLSLPHPRPLESGTGPPPSPWDERAGGQQPWRGWRCGSTARARGPPSAMGSGSGRRSPCLGGCASRTAGAASPPPAWGSCPLQPEQGRARSARGRGAAVLGIPAQGPGRIWASEGGTLGPAQRGGPGPEILGEGTARVGSPRRPRAGVGPALRPGSSDIQGHCVADPPLRWPPFSVQRPRPPPPPWVSCHGGDFLKSVPRVRPFQEGGRWVWKIGTEVRGRTQGPEGRVLHAFEVGEFYLSLQECWVEGLRYMLGLSLTGRGFRVPVAALPSPNLPAPSSDFLRVRPEP
ncbi:uncharacterized protein [Macaca nemestrina]|uniref:uncharacterized protein n=1 Tax=Macaca nemestrina TaxID=9545 RepID=UPI0039B9755E